jgi:RNA polymerase sigma factor (sigma-70 family)
MENVSVSSGGARTNVILLGWAQEFLRAQLHESRPDSLIASAWDEFYRIYDGLVRRFACAQGMRGSDLDDCVQAVWLEVASSLGEFRHPVEHSGLRSWLYTLVRSKASDLIRRRRRPVESLDAVRETGVEPLSRETDPAQATEKQWEHALLETLLDELRSEISDTNWQLLRMRCLEGREVADVAAELGLTPEQVWYRQHRLTKKLHARAAVFTGAELGGTDDESAGEL